MTAENKTRIWTITISAATSLLIMIISLAVAGTRDDSKEFDKRFDQKVDKEQYYLDRDACEKKIEKQEEINSTNTELLMKILQNQEKQNTNIEWLMKKQR